MYVSVTQILSRAILFVICVGVYYLHLFLSMVCHDIEFRYVYFDDFLDLRQYVLMI